MTNYELVMIVDPTLSDDDRTSKIDAVKTILENAGAKITTEDVIGDKKLAYKINKKDRAFYVLYTIELD